MVSSYRGYRAPQGMLSWALQRLSGLGILAFLHLHTIDIFIIGYGPKDFNDLLFLYHNPIFKIGELILVAAVYYHAANGVRIILIDFWRSAYRYERQLWWIVWIAFVVAMIPTTIRMF